MPSLDFVDPYADFPSRFPLLMRHELIGGGIACHTGWKPMIERCFERMEAVIAQGMMDGFERSPNPDFTAGIDKEDLAIPQLADNEIARARKGWVQDPARGDWVRVPFLVQVKEKLGGLRIYGDGLHTTPALVVELRAAEQEASKTCEVCGDAGEMLSIKGYYTVRCAKHSKKA